MLMTGSAESNLVTLVKPWSTWVVTSKISSTIPNDPLDQVNTCGQTLVKGTVKPCLNPNVLNLPPELLPRSPNFTKTLQNLPM
jgi:hypothetical protein